MKSGLSTGITASNAYIYGVTVCGTNNREVEGSNQNGLRITI